MTGYEMAGAYPLITVEFMRRRFRKMQCGIVSLRLLPLPCALCGRPVVDEKDNRAEWFPRQRILQVRHYVCAWNDLFGRIYSAGGRTASVRLPNGVEVRYQSGKEVVA